MTANVFTPEGANSEAGSGAAYVSFQYSHNVYIWRLVSMETTVRVNASSTFFLLISFAVWFLKKCRYLTGWQWEQRGCSFSDVTKSFILKIINKLKWAGNNVLCLSSQSHSSFLSFSIEMHSNEIISALWDICIARLFLFSTAIWSLKCNILYKSAIWSTKINYSANWLNWTGW